MLLTSELRRYAKYIYAPFIKRKKGDWFRLLKYSIHTQPHRAELLPLGADEPPTEILFFKQDKRQP